MCLALTFFRGRNPVSRTFETKITGKMVRYQKSIMASENAYVPIRYEVNSIDTAITYDIPVNKSLWEKLDSGDRVVIDLHLIGEYSFKKKITE